MFNEEINKRIKLLYQNEPELAYRILLGDPEAIRCMGIDNDFSAETIIYAFENNKLEDLYKEAKRKKDIYKLYEELCLELTKINLEEIEEKTKSR